MFPGSGGNAKAPGYVTGCLMDVAISTYSGKTEAQHLDGA